MRREWDWYAPPQPTVGFAQATGGQEESAPGEFAAVLWVPDVEGRHGWREYYIKRNEPKPGARPIGFRK